MYHGGSDVVETLIFDPTCMVDCTYPRLGLLSRGSGLRSN